MCCLATMRTKFIGSSRPIAAICLVVKFIMTLTNGKELFSTTTPALTLAYEDSGVYRYIGYDDGAGSEQPAEMEHDNTILGILSYAGDGIATRNSR